MDRYARRFEGLDRRWSQSVSKNAAEMSVRLGWTSVAVVVSPELSAAADRLARRLGMPVRGSISRDLAGMRAAQIVDLLQEESALDLS